MWRIVVAETRLPLQDRRVEAKLLIIDYLIGGA
jgi:hypothetical protein